MYDDTLLTRVDWERLRFLLYLLASLNSVLLEIMRLPWSPMPESGAQIIKQELGWLDERGILEVPFYSPAPMMKRT